MRLLADENFNGRILKGLRIANPSIEIIRVQDTEIYGTEDAVVLEWATKHSFILLTHDIKTMPKYAYERIHAGLPMLGVIAISRSVPIGVAIEDLLIILDASSPEEYRDRVVFIPL